MASVRDSFFNKVYDLVKSGEDIVVITSDLGAPSLDDFRKYYPERYISVGIAEQSLITIAAGLALSGKKVIAYGLNPFPVTRAYDQIRSLMAEFNIPITLCALNAGLCSAECGYTHMPIEDVGMMRMLTNVQIVNPSDEAIAIRLAEDILSCNNPRYIRFDKSINGFLYNDAEIDFDTGFSIYGGADKCKIGIVTNGCFVKQLRDIVDKFESKGMKIQLLDLYSLPVNEKKLAHILKNYENILTIEENILSAGLGSYVLEIMSDYNITIPVKRLGLRLPNRYYDVFVNRSYIREDQGLDEVSITDTINSL